MQISAQFGTMSNVKYKLLDLWPESTDYTLQDGAGINAAIVAGVDVPPETSAGAVPGGNAAADHTADIPMVRYSLLPVCNSHCNYS